MKCDLAKSDGRLTCKVCGFSIRDMGKSVVRECGPRASKPDEIIPDPIDCIHRGEQLREIGCQTCGGRSVMIPVYACEIHGECLLRRSKAGADLKCCLSCGERVTSPSPAS